MTSDVPSILGITSDDLAPADLRSADFDWTGLRVRFIDSADDDQFEIGYAALWEEFGPLNEMESRAVLEQRLGWRCRVQHNDRLMRYEMIVVTDSNGELAAVRDHTAVISPGAANDPVVIHLSHGLVMPRYRGTGLSGWMRALPIRVARECLRSAHLPPRPITLVAEMEPADPDIPGRMNRLLAYEKVGFLKIDPTRVHYLQPDFRPPPDIDAAGRGPTPVPLSLVVRRVARESERTVLGAEVRSIVTALYAMYAESFRPQDMSPIWASLQTYPADDEEITLVPPTRV